DADRVGHRVEQGVVAQARGFGVAAGRAQRVAGLGKQDAELRGDAQVAAGAVQRLCDLRGAVIGRQPRSFLRQLSARAHEAIRARVTLLPVSRPSRAASQRPVSLSASRSMPVSIPMPRSIYATSSLATFPVAPRAYGQPPVPETA